MAEAEAPAGAAAALVLLAVLTALALVVRRRWRRAAARREEVRRLARLAAEEAEFAEREAARAYYAELFPRVVHAAEAPVAPLWTPTAVTAEQQEVEAPPHPPAGAKGVCVVCYMPTTMRCKQCKAVKYCSFKCQIAHWRQGHKYECRPPSGDDSPDSGIKVSDAEKVEQNSASEDNVVVRVEPAAKTNKPVAVSADSCEANHAMESLNDTSKDIPLEVKPITSESSEDGHAESKFRHCQNAGEGAALIPDTSDSKKTEPYSESANPAKNGSYSNNSDDLTHLCKPQVGAQTIIGHGTLIGDESIDRPMHLSSEKGLKVHDSAVSEVFSQIAHDQRSADNSNFQSGKPARTKDSLHVTASFDGSNQLGRLKTQASGTANLNSSKCLSSTSTIHRVSSIRGGRSVTPDTSKRADNLPESIVRSSANARSTPNNLASSIKKILIQQTPKAARHYPSELTLFPYELFVKLYNFDKVELCPFGLRNLGNSCYANVVLQCLTFTRPLTAYLLEGLHSKNCSKKEWCFMCEFEKLIVEGKQGKAPLSPTGILSHLHDIGSSFGPGKEEDAHEFLRYAIDAMQSVCMKEARKNGTHRLAEETTLVQLIFGGYLRSKIKCTQCQVSSEQYERMLDLTVEIDGDINTLEEALHRFTSTEILDGENKYHCSRCKSYERAKKKLTISEAPNILTIALKRYQFGKFSKISKAIKFPENLNLARYMSASDDNTPVYRLYAVVVHQDVMNAVFSGHYVCYVKDTQGKWYKVNDSQVEPVPLENVLSKCAYMLLYARCSPRAPNSVRKVMMSQDLARAKKDKQRVVDSGPTALQGGGSWSRRQGGQLHTDHISDVLARTLDTYGDTRYPPVDSPSPSESSSLFSNSDAGSLSTDSTDSTRNSTSTEYEYIFGTLDQMYPGSPMEVADEYEVTYPRWSFGLNPSSSGREVDRAGEVERLVEYKRQGTREGWVEGHKSPSFLYADQCKQQNSSKLTEQCRKIDETDHDPGEGRGSVLLRRPTRKRTAQTFY